MTLRDAWQILTEDWIGRAIIGLVVLAIALAVLLIAYAIHDERRWEQFKSDQQCRLVESEDGRMATGYGVMSNGKSGVVVSHVPGKEAWACNDGVTYWRSK